MARHSGLQLQVLALFRSALRVARSKDQALAVEAAQAAVEAQAVARTRGGANYQYVRERFRDDALSVGRKDFAVIEHLLRKGQKDLKMLEKMKSASFTSVSR